MPNFKVEHIALGELKPHPRNYRKHPEDQLQHIVQSIKEHGLYRNVVIAKDNTILAGHGVVQACALMELETIPVIRVDLEPESAQAMKLLAGDNEIANLGEIDDRVLTEMLRDIKDLGENGLLGTGFDDEMLANLVMVTRPKSEIKNMNEAAAWVGMPDYEGKDDPLKITVAFESFEDRTRFLQLIDVDYTEKTKSVWWPRKERKDTKSIKFVEDDENEGHVDSEAEEGA